MVPEAKDSTPKRSRYLLGGALVCWAGAAGLFGSAAYDSVQRWRVLHANAAQAQVVMPFATMEHGQLAHSLGVGFVDANGNQQLADVPVTERQFEQVAEGTWIPIRYRPDNPDEALLASDSTMRLRHAGALLAALGLFAIGWVSWQRWRREQQKQT